MPLISDTRQAIVRYNPNTLSLELWDGTVITGGGGGGAVDQGAAGVSAWLFALPAGASTSAKQDTGNTSLGSIDGKLPALSGGRVPVVLPAGGSGLTDAELRATAVPVSGTFWQATQPVSGTVTTTPPANASTNLAQIVGTAADVNSGNKSAGTLRVVLATDQPALTNKLLVTPDSVALPANQSVNVSQVAGTAASVNSGTKDAGTLRVVLATDQPALTNKLLVTPDSVALPANQSVNVSQLAGTATAVNSGNKDAGTLRVVLATDQPALTNKLLVTPDSVALPANQSTNVNQVGGVAIALNTGTRSAGTQRVTIATDDLVPVSGTVTANAGTNLNTSALLLDATFTGRLPAAAAGADGLANPTITQIGADAMLYNGSTWDRARGNWRTTTGDTGAKTVTFNGATQTNYDSRGVWILIQLGTVSGTTPTLAAQMQFSYDGGTTFLNFGAALANLTASNQTGLIMVYPTNLSQAAGGTPANLTSGATQTLAINAPLSRTWRILYTIGGTSPSFTITAVHVLYAK